MAAFDYDLGVIGGGWAGTVYIYPTLAEISKRVAQEPFTAKIFSETTPGVLRFLFDLKGRACTPPGVK
ncbi:MAG: hypothetical protein ACYC5X_06100 [Syntrophales bacterium]